MQDISSEELEVLKNPNLMRFIVDDVHKSYYGEEDSIMAICVSICTRLVENCSPESKNLTVSEVSGGGKDALVSNVCRIFLDNGDNYIHRAKLTPEVFTYWHSNEDDWSWDGKVIHIEDPTPDLINCQGFKTMASGKKHSTVVKDQKAKDLKVNGKPNMIITSYSSVAELETVRRFPFIHLDTSNELTRLVKLNVAKQETGKPTIKGDVTLISALKKLKSYKVIIPFAEELVDCMSDDLLSRTYFKRFLDYIKASAILHQYQRCKTKDNSIVATWLDYVLARISFLKTISNESMVSLNRDQQRLLGLLKSEGKPMNVSELHQGLAKPKTWIYRNLDYLKEYKLITEKLLPHPVTTRETAYFEIFLLCSYGIPTAPLDKIPNISVFPEIMKEVDDKRKKQGLPPIYERYYSLISWNIRNVGIYNQSTGENTKNTNRNISGISQEYLTDDVIKMYGGKKVK